MSAETVHAETIPNSYIVVFKKNLEKEVCERHCEWANKCHSERISALSSDEATSYEGIKNHFRLRGWQGYACSVDEQTKKQIEESDEVDFVEPDMKVYASKLVTADAPSWGLGRISSKEKQTGSDAYKKYTYDDSAGEGVRCYVVCFALLIASADTVLSSPNPFYHCRLIRVF